ncbi:NAD(P)-binding protein [Periconia macrospinosa]|uniref:NAD(P)-binding protein n=1 Tax=Periconia macrospinosa TaxID=97972 RepID=A0A2V1DNY5_9PLEO|nr:NAD(P)-binding protein [Periconia macrospinosa]
MTLNDKVFAITGGASGIGLATAKLLSARGGTVCIGDLDPVALKEAESYFAAEGRPFLVTHLDVSSKMQVEEWIKTIVDKYGNLYGAVNVAGYIGKDHGVKPVAELDDEEWNRIIAVNLTGCMYCLREELKNIARGGSIVNVSSIHGTVGMANYGAYDASKHGVIGLTKAAAKENGGAEIRVNAVAPGAIYTPMMQKFWDKSNRPKDAPFDDPTSFQRQGTAEEVANVIVFLLGPESTFVSGSVYAVDGAWL